MQESGRGEIVPRELTVHGADDNEAVESIRDDTSDSGSLDTCVQQRLRLLGSCWELLGLGWSCRIKRSSVECPPVYVTLHVVHLHQTLRVTDQTKVAASTDATRPCLSDNILVGGGGERLLAILLSLTVQVLANCRPWCVVSTSSQSRLRVKLNESELAAGSLSDETATESWLLFF